MAPVDQSHPKGCFQACVASVLDLPLSDVPDFCAPGFNGNDWWGGFQDWCGKRGLIALEVSLPDGKIRVAPMPDGLIGILSGKSPRGDWPHSVVVKFSQQHDGFKIVHDPHESRAGIEDGATHLLFFVRTGGY